MKSGLRNLRKGYKQFDVVKLCLLLLLHLFLIGGDERGKVPIWQVRLVDNLDSFDVFPWGCLVYSYSIYGFKTALSTRRGRFEQKLKYNMWGFSYALLVRLTISYHCLKLNIYNFY